MRLFSISISSISISISISIADLKLYNSLLICYTIILY